MDAPLTRGMTTMTTTYLVLHTNQFGDEGFEGHLLTDVVASLAGLQADYEVTYELKFATPQFRVVESDRQVVAPLGWSAFAVIGGVVGAPVAGPDGWR